MLRPEIKIDRMTPAEIAALRDKHAALPPVPRGNQSGFIPPKTTGSVIRNLRTTDEAAAILPICQTCDRFTVADPDGLVVGCDACSCSAKRVSLTRGKCPLGKW